MYTKKQYDQSIINIFLLGKTTHNKSTTWNALQDAYGKKNIFISYCVNTNYL
jgi:predicted GTPase